MLAVPEPFVAYMRVYEPLSSFESPVREQLTDAAMDPIESSNVSVREQDLWLRTQICSPTRLLPGETVDGTPKGTRHVLVLDAEDVPTGEATSVGPGPLVCPLDLRGRAAAALVGFIGAADPPLRAAALTHPVDKARVHAGSVVQELATSAVHVLSSTWTVPLPWFAVVDPTERQVIDPVGGTGRRVCWRIAMTDARRRVVRAHSVSRDSVGDEGPTKILREIGRWLERFHAQSAVELDYGGLARVMSEADVDADTSAEDVHAIIDAMEVGDTGEVNERYEALRDFWSTFAARERYN